MSLQLSQMELVSAILAEIDRQCPGSKMPPCRVFNLICQSATAIVSEAAISFKAASPGMGLAAWLRSDDTGLSSRYMAHVVYGGPKCERNHPHDSADWGRCLRLIEACGKPDQEKLKALQTETGWGRWIETLTNNP